MLSGLQVTSDKETWVGICRCGTNLAWVCGESAGYSRCAVHSRGGKTGGKDANCLKGARRAAKYQPAAVNDWF